MWKACYSNLAGGLQRRSIMAQLHIYPDGIETVPEEILNSKYFLYVCTYMHYVGTYLCMQVVEGTAVYIALHTFFNNDMY